MKKLLYSIEKITHSYIQTTTTKRTKDNLILVAELYLENLSLCHHPTVFFSWQHLRVPGFPHLQHCWRFGPDNSVQADVLRTEGFRACSVVTDPSSTLLPLAALPNVSWRVGWTSPLIENHLSSYLIPSWVVELEQTFLASPHLTGLGGLEEERSILD